MKIPNLKLNIISILLLLLLDCSLVGFIAFWREGFWTAVEQRHLIQFGWYLGSFSIVALLSCFVGGYQQYLINYATLVWRSKLTRKAFKLKDKTVEGHEQRVQQDCLDYPSLIFNLSIGLLRNIINGCVFVYILITRLGFIYLILPIVYVIIGTLLASFIAKPLVSLNYINQVAEAKFRRLLTKMNYSAAYKNNINLAKRTKYLSYFQSFYNQITVIVPYIILYPVYFSSKIVFGTFMQCASAMNSVIDGLSFIINSFDSINKMRSCHRRLKEIKIL